jgi:hypothetical protein
VSVRYETGTAIIQLEGDYTNQWYSVSRGDGRQGPFVPLNDTNVLCMGACFASDMAVQAGRTYWYRFDLQLADGSFTAYGPYPVTISDAIARRLELVVGPQPLRGPARIELRIAGAAGEAPVPVRIDLFDLQGRRARTIHQGALARGRNVLTWNGGDLAAGVYLMRAESPLGIATTRVVRAR